MISLRMSPDILAEIDAYRSDQGDPPPSLSDAVRQLVVAGLEEHRRPR